MKNLGVDIGTTTISAVVFNKEAGKILASGNGFRKNPILQKICKEMFLADLKLSPYLEEAACGAAISCTVERSK